MSKQIITGKWIKEGKNIIKDSNCALIKKKLTNDLIKVAISIDGWDILFKGRNFDLYWELTYPQSELHGGGPARLESFNYNEIKNKYSMKIGD